MTFRTHRLLTASLLAAWAAAPSLAGWDETGKLTAEDAQADDNFGNSVAIRGNIALIGSHLDDHNGFNSGSAFVFNTITGTQITKLTPTDGAGFDSFGWSVALSGNIALIGSRFDSVSGNESGSAYLFNASTGAQIAKVTPSDIAAYDSFGYAVAISGNTALIGSDRDDDNGSNSGSAYVFDATTGMQIRKIKPNDGAANDWFGRAVALSGDIAVIGSSGDRDNGTESGSAYLFNVTTGTQIAKLKPEDGAANDLFGASVGISGTTAIVGALLNDDNGTDSGSAYLFNVNTGMQTAKLTASDAAAFDWFGASVGISGTTAIVGAFQDNDGGTDTGSVYLFSTITGNQIGKLTASDATENDNFGVSVGISGTTVIAGARYDDDGGYNAGSAYLFGMDSLSADPTGGTLAFDVAADTSITLSDLIELSNTGDMGTVINVTGFLITGDDAGLFTVIDYADATLTAGASDTVLYNLYFSGQALGQYDATLTLFTDSGNVQYGLEANVVPEPTSLALVGLSGLAILRRRR